MASVDVRTVDIDDLMDLRDLTITKEDKWETFAAQIKNPYVYRIGDYVIKISFSEDGPDFEDIMEEYVKHLAILHTETQK